MHRLLALLAACVVFTPGATASSAVSVKAAYNANLKATILVDARGLTLYYYAGDSPKTSVCVNDPQFHCSKLWPPLVVQGAPVAGKGAKKSLLGTLKREDGRTQVTYAGHPLYRYQGGVSGPPDRKPGDVYGQAAVSQWWVLSPTGKTIKTPRR
jgi:predicted lipoprotein with Yx(FWY)xxD motif